VEVFSVFSKNQIDTKKDTSRNINLSSDIIKKGKTLKVEEKKSQFLQNAYTKIKNGNFDSIEDIIHKYLKEVKKVNSNEEKDLMDYYNHKNFRNNLIELNMKVGDDSIRKKIEKIYYNTYILKRITNTLNIMKEKENNIDRLEKIYTSGANVNH
jgi:predicted transcriptional regulator